LIIAGRQTSSTAFSPVSVRRGPSGSCTAIGPLVTTAIGAVDVLAALLILDHDPHRDRV